MRLKNNNRNGYDEKYMKIKINSNNGLPFENIKNIQYKDTYKICFDK